MCVCLWVFCSGENVSPGSTCGVPGPGSVRSADVESSAAEADQDMAQDTG